MQVGWALFFSLFVLPKKFLIKEKKRKKKFFPGSRTRFGTEYHRQNRQNFADQGPPFSFPALSPFFPHLHIYQKCNICMYVCMYVHTQRLSNAHHVASRRKGRKEKKRTQTHIGWWGSNARIHTDIHTHTHTHTHIHTYIHTYKHTYIHTYIHTYTHTHTHTHTYIHTVSLYIHTGRKDFFFVINLEIKSIMCVVVWCSAGART